MKVRIEQDIDPMSPREWDNLGIMVCFHGRYNLGDETDLKSSMFDGWDGLRQHLENEEGATHILPLYLYDHSGITMRAGDPGDFRAVDSAGWDWGQVGFIYATKETMKLIGTAPEDVEDVLRGEVAVYDQYLRGDVWGYIIEDEDGEHLDSCWGFFGREHVEEEAESARRSLSSSPEAA